MFANLDSSAKIGIREAFPAYAKSEVVPYGDNAMSVPTTHS